MKRFASVLLFGALAIGAYAQSDYNTNYSTYWNQRATLFQVLPIDSDDIVFLGNSITDGCNWEELFGNANCKNRGISGDTSDGILARLDPIVLGHPAKIFMMIGTNDMSRGKSVDEIVANFTAILDRIAEESPETKVYVESVLPVNDHYGMFNGHTSRWQMIPEINARYKAIAEERGLTYVDLFAKFENGEGKMNTAYSNDGLHLNGAGYMLWHDTVEPLVNE